MSKKIFLLSIFTVFLLLPSIVSAINFVPSDVSGWPNDALALFFGPNIPDWMVQDVYSVLQWLIFPFISLWVILYGILTELRLFRGREKLNGVIALLIALIAGPTGGLVYLVRVVFVAFGYYAFMIFAVLLFVGTGLWGWARYRWWKPSGENWGQAAKRLNNLQNLNKRIKYYETRSNASWLTAAERKHAVAEFKRLTDERKNKFGQ